MPRAAKETKATKATKTGKARSPAKATKASGAAKATKTTKAAKTTKTAKATKATKTASTPKATKAGGSAKATKTTRATKSVSTAKTRSTKAPKVARKSGSVEYNNFEPYKPRRGEKYMNDQQRLHFKAILLNWKSELMQEVDRTVTHMKDEAANFPDPADRATQEEEFSLELRTRDRERKLIKKIDATMELIEQNDYGFCEACGVEIGIQRLEARPTATQCIDCKTLAEIKEKQEMG
jgi:DnaK suppressor protein